ncbi:MAG TPA: HEAT repeat domain-containing protein, partial [Candidatus Krumholzibacteria bacterium]|nr:HEAT repeat domain-containing protein [Candidatus Krumholzibacteria bacterium]
MKQHRSIVWMFTAAALCVTSSSWAGNTPKAPKAKPTPVTPGTPAPAPVANPNTERGAYDQIKDMIYDGQYQQAYEGSTRFLKKYPKSANAEEVSFWKCYALQRAARDLGKSFDCYQTFLAQYPNGNWSDDARAEYVKVAKKLAKAGDPRAKAALEQMRDAGDAGEVGDAGELKLSVIYALMQSGDEADMKLALDSIHQMLKTSKDPELRRKVLYILTESDDPTVMDTLIDVAKTDPDADVRRHAIYAISEQKDDPKVIDTLVGIMKTEKDPDIRRHVLYAIAEVDRPDVIKVLSDAALNDPDKDIRTAATYAIAEVDDPTAVTALKSLLKTSPSFDIKRAALYALVERDDVDIVP